MLQCTRGANRVRTAFRSTQVRARSTASKPPGPSTNARRSSAPAPTRTAACLPRTARRLSLLERVLRRGSDQEETLLPACLAQGPHPRIPPHVSALGVDYFDAVGRRELGDPRKDLFGPSNVSVAMDPIRSKRTLASHLLPLEIRFCWTLPGRKPDRQR